MRDLKPSDKTRTINDSDTNMRPTVYIYLQTLNRGT